MPHQLVEVNTITDIFPQYRETPVGLLLEYHNLNKTFSVVKKPQILIGTCMDNRKSLWIPENFAYIIRAGGANLMYSEFQVSYAISMAGLRYIALIAHSNCEMVNLHTAKDQFVQGMVDHAGWHEENAEHHFDHLSGFYEIGDELGFIIDEAKRLQKRYPKVMVAALFLNDEGRLCQIEAMK